uniref:Putative head tail connector protein n=1 Tax=viral metagenome TaxID=1070528 RepID=A0A6M3IGZ1_9ZZZZ
MAKASQAQIDNQKKWEDRINRAKKVRENWKQLFRVDMAREFFDGKQNPGFPQNEWITINKIYSHLKAQLPALYNANPYFYVKLRKAYSVNPLQIANWEKRGQIRQSYLNYLKDELDLKSKARLSVQDGFFAYGVAKTYYKADKNKNPDYGNSILGEDGLPVLDEKTGMPIPEPEFIPANERYCISRIHPDDFLWGEDSGTLEENWTWVAQCVRMTLEEAQKDDRFSKAAIARLKESDETEDDERKKRKERKTGDIKSRGESRFGRSNKKEKEKIVYVWEIWDLKEERWSVIAENGEIPLVDEEELPPGVEDHPFSILRFTLRDDSPYPIPPLSQGIDPQKEYCLARSRIMVHRKRFNRKYEVNIAALEDESELSKLESGDDGTIIRTRQLGAVQAIDDAPLDQMNYNELAMLNADMTELFGGSTGESRGIAEAESATQAGILDKRLEMKEGDAMSMVVDFVCSIARKLDQLVQVHITKEEAVKITGGPNGEFWELVQPQAYEEIEGEYAYSVNVGATIPRLPQLERSQWLAFLQFLGGFPHLLTAPHFMKKMAEMFHIEDEVLVEELRQIGLKIMSGQMAPPNAQGSQARQPEMKPASVVGGQAGGPQSLALPGAGNLPG